MASDFGSILPSDATAPIVGSDGIDTVDFSGIPAENPTTGAFTGVIVDLDVNSAGAIGTPSQDGGILDLPPAAGGTIIDDLTITDVENIIGTDFNDGLFGNNEVNIIEGGAGNDIVHGFAGDDFQSGGEGTDTVLFAAAPASVFVDLNLQVSDADFAAIIDGSLPAVFAATGGAGNNVLNGFENIVGGGSDDTLIGDDGDNVITGNGGADSLVGNGGDDTFVTDGADIVLDGGAGSDTADLSSIVIDDTVTGVTIDLDTNTPVPGPETEIGLLTVGDSTTDLVDIENVVGTSGDDLILGNNELNTLSGGAGDDAIHSFAGADFLNGDEGIDTALFTAGGAVIVDLDETGGATSNFGDTLTGFENINGSATGGDEISGNSGVNVLFGNGGDDTLNGEGGADTLLGGDGDDLIISDGTDAVDGGADIDTADFSGVADGVFVDVSASLTAAIEVLEDGSADLPEVGETPAVFELGTGVSRISNSVVNGVPPGGEALPDVPTDIDVFTIVVPEGTVLTELILSGFDSTDNLGFVAIQEGSDVTVDFSAPAEEIDTSPLLGLANFGNEPAPNASTGTNILPALGDGGGLVPEEAFVGFDGAAGLPAGTFTILVQQLGAAEIEYSVDFVVQDATDPTIGFGTIAGVENLVGTDALDVLTGDDGDNVLAGGGGVDVLTGLGGDDTFVSDATDLVFGGDGNDTIDFSDATGGIVIDLDLNTPAPGPESQDGAVLTALGGDVIAEVDDVENVIGTGFEDVIFGNNEINVLVGGGSDDVFHSFGGPDVIDGGSGNDLVLFSAAPVGVVVDLDDDGNATSSFGDTLIAIENINGSVAGDDDISGNSGTNILDGQGGNDTLDGEGGADVLFGGEGEDLLLGRGGRDELFGEDGDDVLFGQGGADLVQGNRGADAVFGGFGADTVLGGGGDDDVFGGFGADRVSGGFGDDLVVGGFGADRVRGGAGDDVLFGNGGRDRLNGNDGDDVLIGGGGRDRLTGGEGDDLFVVGPSGRDVITDFEAGSDTIQLIGVDVEDLSDVSVTQDGDDVLIQGLPTQQVRLLDTDADEITVDSFDNDGLFG